MKKLYKITFKKLHRKKILNNKKIKNKDSNYLLEKFEILALSVMKTCTFTAQKTCFRKSRSTFLFSMYTL